VVTDKATAETAVKPDFKKIPENKEETPSKKDDKESEEDKKKRKKAADDAAEGVGNHAA